MNALGEKGLDHDKLFGLMNSLIGIETGSSLFLSIMSKYPEFYDHLEKWRFDVQYCIQKEYSPQQCDRFCPYCEVCCHTRNILTTSHPSRNLMEPDPNYDVRYCSLEETQNDVYEVIHDAYMQNDNSIYIIKAQVGIGKSYSYLRIMEENPDERFLIAAPTNLLKNELYKKAKSMGIDACMTPSLEEIKDEIPAKVWKRIQWLYKRGQHRSVALYIKKALENEDIACFDDKASFCLSGNSNDIDFLLYDLERTVVGQLRSADAGRKQLQSASERTKGILRAEVRLIKPKAVMK